MKRTLKAFGLMAAALMLFASCKDDDDTSYVPPRDYTEQYATEKAQIEEYLHTHYIVSVDADFNVTLDTIVDASLQTSIWDQTEYPLQTKVVHSINEDNTPEYTIYYLQLQQGVGIAPTRADNIRVSLQGFQLVDGAQFENDPYPDSSMSMTNLIEGWQEIIPLFKPGVYVDEPNNPEPPSFQNYGAGVMFIPSGLAFYNTGATGVGAYEPVIFTFKLYGADYLDYDSDGVLNINERPSEFADIYYVDTDGDGNPDYNDTDDDGDGYPTLLEITNPETDEPYDFADIPTTICSPSGTTKVHLDATCHPPQ